MIFDGSDSTGRDPVDLHLVLVLVDVIDHDLSLTVGQPTPIAKNLLILLLLPVRELVVAQSVTRVSTVVLLFNECIILLEDLEPLFEFKNIIVMDAKLSKMLDVADLRLESSHRRGGPN